MAEVKVMRTSGSEAEILEKSGGGIIQLYITSPDNCKSEHEIGDLLSNESSDIKFALLARLGISTKILVSALRVSVIALLRMMVSMEDVPSSILISKDQFLSSKEEAEFVATVREFCDTYFGEVLVNPITIIISDYKELEL